MAVIIDMEKETSVIFSACIAVFYTLFGGLYSVAYTDVIQLFCIFIGLWMCIPFAWTNPHVKSLSSMEVDWIGEIGEKKRWFYIDYGLLLVFGGIPWQVRLFGNLRIEHEILFIYLFIREKYLRYCFMLTAIKRSAEPKLIRLII